MSNFDPVTPFKLLDKEFTMDLNELTPTLKIRRKVIIDKFLHLIEDMYDDLIVIIQEDIGYAPDED